MHMFMHMFPDTLILKQKEQHLHIHEAYNDQDTIEYDNYINPRQYRFFQYAHYARCVGPHKYII
jgi:hypothetical protein